MASSTTVATTLRTHTCGALRGSDAGAEVRLGGWVHRKRDLGELVFVDLRDRSGLVQISFDPRYTPTETVRLAATLGPESVVLVQGEVVARPTEMRNADIPTGDVEVRAKTLEVVGPAAAPAIPVARVRAEPLPAEEL
ncbi:MAG TPA: OB-fold nucleic acid binding domain-containing protein, partial [Gemmatimonadaceae bacterium]|nr:OB-fold nucleic acid binding domain-containing protein [Gemmatimonadaceae bacterium]